MRVANERSAAGEDVLHLEVGQPGTPAPTKVLEAARRALEENRLGYTDALGMPALRQRIAEHYKVTYGLEVPAERIAVTVGASGAILLGLLAAFDPGDRVALAAPSYPCYRNMLSALGNEPVILESELEHRFQPTPELLERVEGPLHGLFIASPSNPAGTMVDRQAMSRLVEYCAERGIRILSDEIYHGISYGEPAVSALELSDAAIIINSFSKYFSMTGWRLGWMVMPSDLARAIERMAQNLFISAPTLSQLAGLAAFDCRQECDALVAAYARNRALLLERLPRAGFDRLAPADGAFYIYADVGRLTNDSDEFCRRMLTEAGVAATPGIDFDEARGHRFVRFSFAGAEAEIAEAADRLESWLTRRRGLDSPGRRCLSAAIAATCSTSRGASADRLRPHPRPAAPRSGHWIGLRRWPARRGVPAPRHQQIRGRHCRLRSARHPSPAGSVVRQSLRRAQPLPRQPRPWCVAAVAGAVSWSSLRRHRRRLSQPPRTFRAFRSSHWSWCAAGVGAWAWPARTRLRSPRSPQPRSLRSGFADRSLPPWRHRTRRPPRDRPRPRPEPRRAGESVCAHPVGHAAAATETCHRPGSTRPSPLGARSPPSRARRRRHRRSRARPRRWFAAPPRFRPRRRDGVSAAAAAACGPPLPAPPRRQRIPRPRAPPAGFHRRCATARRPAVPSRLRLRSRR